MKETLIKFLKNNNVFDKYVEELNNQDYTLDEVIDESLPAFYEVFEDNFCFKYEDQITDIYWEDIDKKWKAFYARAKTEFLGFLKKNYALTEFDIELKTAEVNFNEVDCNTLEDGHYFFYAEQATRVDWDLLNKKWQIKYKEIK